MLVGVGGLVDGRLAGLLHEEGNLHCLRRATYTLLVFTVHVLRCNDGSLYVGQAEIFRNAACATSAARTARKGDESTARAAGAPTPGSKVHAQAGAEGGVEPAPVLVTFCVAIVFAVGSIPRAVSPALIQACNPGCALGAMLHPEPVPGASFFFSLRGLGGERDRNETRAQHGGGSQGDQTQHPCMESFLPSRGDLERE